jgi:hypothetical protein
MLRVLGVIAVSSYLIQDSRVAYAARLKKNQIQEHPQLSEMSTAFPLDEEVFSSES